MNTVLACVSSLFLAFKRSNDPSILPNGLFNECNKLRVLVLCYCAFSFVSPPFQHCHGLRFLGLDCCKDNKTTIVERKDCNMIWNWLHSLWVLDLRYTEWGVILSEQKLERMVNIKELNMQGVRCWRYTSKLQSRLPHLERLRIVKPIIQSPFKKTMHQSEESADISASLVEETNLEIIDLSGNKDMKNLPTSLSKARNLQVLILDGCDGLETVVLPGRLASSLRSFSFDGYGPAPHWKSTIELPSESSRPKELSTTTNKDVQISKIILEGCTELENLFLRGLPNLVELDLSGSAIKVLDLETMVHVPGIKRLFLLGCENLRAIKWGSRDYTKQLKLEFLCIDTRPGRAFGCARPSYEQYKPFQVHAVLVDARLVRSLWRAIYGHATSGFSIHIHITSSAVSCGVTRLEGTSKGMVGLSDKKHLILAGRYGDVLTRIGDPAMQGFPEPPNQQFDRHIEIGDGSHSLESELVTKKPFSRNLAGQPFSRNLAGLMTDYGESLHVHDVSTRGSIPSGAWRPLRWCRVERCAYLDTIFPSDTAYFENLDTIWASDLLMARSIISKASSYFRNNYPAGSFSNLRHLHLRSCPRLKFVLAVWVRMFPNLQTLHIVHCHDLKHVFVVNEKTIKSADTFSAAFPKQTTIHLHSLPMLRQISEFRMSLPALETMSIRGCFGLRRLPAVPARGGGMRKPTVEIEKDVWDALEWEGGADHHPGCFEVPLDSRYYKRRHLRGTVLR